MSPSYIKPDPVYKTEQEKKEMFKIFMHLYGYVARAILYEIIIVMGVMCHRRFDVNVVSALM